MNWTALDEPAYSGLTGSFSGLYMGTVETKTGSSFTVLRCGTSGTLKTVNTDNYGGQYTGGLFGLIHSSGTGSVFTVDQCYATGTLHIRTPTGNRSVHGGIAGDVRFTSGTTTNYLRDVYSNIDLLFDTTGTVGISSPTIGRVNYITSPGSTFSVQRIYTSGNLTVPNGSKAATVAGFIGSNSGSTTTISASYFNSDHYASPVGTGGVSPGASGLTTAQLQNSANFIGWDFSTVWEMNPSTNMPRLRSVPLQ